MNINKVLLAVLSFLFVGCAHTNSLSVRVEGLPQKVSPTARQKLTLYGYNGSLAFEEDWAGGHVIASHIYPGSEHLLFLSVPEHPEKGIPEGSPTAEKARFYLLYQADLDGDGKVCERVDFAGKNEDFTFAESTKKTKIRVEPSPMATVCSKF